MQVASLMTKHTASPATMQVAYADVMEEVRRPYRINRQLWLEHWLQKKGGPKKVAELLDSVDTHLTAMAKGRRNVGDELATKMEEAFGLDPGDMDRAPPGPIQKSAQTGKINAGDVVDFLAERLIALEEDARTEIAKRVNVLATTPDSAMGKQALLKSLIGRTDLGGAIPGEEKLKNAA